MSKGSVTVEGLDVLVRAVEAFPRTVQRALRDVAAQSAARVQTRARQLLRSQTKGTGRTAENIKVIELTDEKAFLVHSAGDPDRPANLPLWLERGTRFMRARPHMRPAADEEEDRYRQNMLDTASQTAEQEFGNK